MTDEIQAEIGANPDGVAAGKNIDQRIRRDSPNVAVAVTSDPLAYYLNQVMQVSIDLRFLANKQSEDTQRLTDSLERLHDDFQRRDRSTSENNRALRDMIVALEKNVQVQGEHVALQEKHIDSLRNHIPMTQGQANAQLIATYALLLAVGFLVWLSSHGVI